LSGDKPGRNPDAAPHGSASSRLEPASTSIADLHLARWAWPAVGNEHTELSTTERAHDGPTTGPRRRTDHRHARRRHRRRWPGPGVGSGHRSVIR